MSKRLRRLSLLALIFIIIMNSTYVCYASEYWTIENIDIQLKSHEGFNGLVKRLNTEGEKIKADKPEMYYYAQGMINVGNNDYKAAFDNLKEASVQAMANKNVALETEALKRLTWIGDFYAESGDLIDYGSRLLELSEKQQDAELELYANNAISLSYYYVANDEKAFEYLEKMLYMAKTTGRKDYQGLYNTIMGHIYFSYLDYEAAKGYYEKAISFFNEKEDDNMLLDLKLLSEAQLMLIKSKQGNGTTEDIARVDSLISKARKRFFNTADLFNLYLIKGQIEKECGFIAGAVDSFSKSKEQLGKIKHIGTSNNIGAFVESSLAEAYFENGNYKEAASMYASIANQNENPNYFKDIDKKTNKLLSFQEKELNSRIELLTNLKDAQNKKIQYQKLILALLAFIIAILVWAFAIITRENKRVISLKNNLYEQSITDSLTGVFNRRKIWEDLNSEDSGNNIVALVDVDNFKNINDSLGHLVGDEVLRRIVESIKNSVREKDEIGRYGGEEFIIILKDTDLNNALKVVERIRENVESLVWGYDNLKTSISIGVACKGDQKAETIFRVVDNLLQEAKDTGKNKVVYRKC